MWIAISCDRSEWWATESGLVLHYSSASARIGPIFAAKFSIGPIFGMGIASSQFVFTAQSEQIVNSTNGMCCWGRFNSHPTSEARSALFLAKFRWKIMWHGWMLSKSNLMSLANATAKSKIRLGKRCSFCRGCRRGTLTESQQIISKEWK